MLYVHLNLICLCFVEIRDSFAEIQGFLRKNRALLRLFTALWIYLVCLYFDRKKPPPPEGFPIYCVASSRTVCKRTPLEEPGTNPSRGVLLHKVLDEGT